MDDSPAFGERSARMSWCARDTRSHLPGDLRTFFSGGEKCEKPFETAHSRHQAHPLKSEKTRKRRNPDLGKNLGDLQQELECQRSARRKALLNPVLGEDLEDGAHHHAELECRGSALLQEALLNPVQCENREDLHDDAHEHGNWNVNGLHEEAENRLHFRQLFRQLRFATRASRRDVLDDDLGHFGNRLGNLEIERREDVHQLFHHLRLIGVEHLLHGAPQNPHLRPYLEELVRPRPPELILVQREELSVPTTLFF